MAIFFSLSGFLITQTLLEGQPVAVFCVRRAARILPLAYLYLLIIFLFFSTAELTLIQNLLFVENYTYAWMADEHFWSLCVEVQFYIAIGIAVLCLGQRAILLIPIACIFVTALKILNVAPADIQTHLRVDEILSGGCIAIAHKRLWLEKITASPVVFFLSAGVLTITSWSHSQGLQYFRPYAAGLLLVATLSLRPCWLREVLTSRAGAYIAKISYALYVIHPITASGWMDAGSTIERYALKRPISFAVTFVLAHISTFYYEAKWINASKVFSAQIVSRGLL